MNAEENSIDMYLRNSDEKQSVDIPINAHTFSKVKKVLAQFNKMFESSIYQDEVFLQGIYESFPEKLRIVVFSYGNFNLEHPDYSRLLALFVYQEVSSYPVLELKSAGVMLGYSGPTINPKYPGIFLEDLHNHFAKKKYFFKIQIDASPIDLGNSNNSIKNVRNDAPFIELNNWIAPVDHKFHQQILYRLRERAESVKFEHLAVNKLQSSKIRELLELHFKFHLLRWPESTFKNSNSPHKKLFYSLFLDQKMKSGGVISILRINSEIAALHFGFIKKRKFLYFSPTINPEFHKYSPGQLLIYKILNELQKHDFQIFDFMNDLEPYKLKWTNQIGSRYFYTLYSHKFVIWNYGKYSPRTLLKLLMKPMNLVNVLFHPIKTARRYTKF